MAKDVVMPALEMAQDRGTLIRWLKEEGDFVQKGEPLMEIETDKADVEVEAPASGTLSNVTAQPGDEVPVGTVIALIVPISETPKEPKPAAAKGAPEIAQTAPVATNHTDRSAAGSSAPARDSAESRGALASPKAKRLAAEANLDLSQVSASGPRGRILASDVLAQSASPKTEREQERPEYTVVPVEGMRRVIAERLQASHRNAPLISLTLSIDVSPAKAFLDELKRQRDTTAAKSPGMTALLCKAAALAVLQYPQLNSHYLDDEIRQFGVVHLGIAVALEDGLVVPVIRDLQSKPLAELQLAIDDVVDRARNGRLKPAELSGSTFTMTNLGMLGVEQFTAILNPPEVGILSVGKICEVARVLPDSSISARPTMQATINADHRAVDGAVGAQFLTAFRSLMENPKQL